MCELLGMASRYPATLTSSLERFARRGGEAGPHADGWGVAFYDGYDVRRLREPEPAARSPWLPFVRSQQRPARLALAHIRKATVGDCFLANTQPFARELGGRMHLFAHNGDLDAIDRRWRTELTHFQPIGTTDSEIAFCALMERLRPLWMRARHSLRHAPPLTERQTAVQAFARELRAYGPANFLYSDGELLFAHGHKRRQDDGEIRPPGLVTLTRTCDPGDGTLVRTDRCPPGGCQEVTLVTSVPLTEEPWRPLEAGEVVTLRLESARTA
jgi:glutamine amidotransferase